MEGVPLVDGGTVRLVSMVGLSKALEIILTGKPVAAEELQKLGVANIVVKCGTGKHFLSLKSVRIAIMIVS